MINGKIIEVEKSLVAARAREGKREVGCGRCPCDKTILYLTVVVVMQIVTGGKIACN